MPDFAGAAKRITAAEVAELADEYGIELAALRAVMAVESRNSGYDSKRRPIILFEPHIYFKELSGNMRAVAVARGLAYQNWKGPGSYPSGSDAQYKRLAAAIAINKEAAYRSVSIGLGQVLGRNYRAAGCSSAVEMFEQAMESERNQLRHMLEFIKSNGIRDELQRRDWAGFALRYNGKGQVPRYAAWLKREYDKWARIVKKPREKLTVADLRDAGSNTISAADTGKKAVAAVAVAVPTATAALDMAQTVVAPVSQAVSTAQQAQSAWQWANENSLFLFVLVALMLFGFGCYFAWRSFNAIQAERVQNARDGINLRI
jgi:hypothetical protein